MTTDRHCLDAETVAAWMDGGLDSASVAAAEAHASTCDRCQALLATVARTLPVEESLARGGSTRRAPFSWWLAPIAAAAAAVTIWMVVPQTPLETPPTASVAREETKAQAQNAEPVPAEPPGAPPAVQEQAPADSRRNVPARESNKLADAEVQNRDALARNRADQQSKREGTAGFAGEVRQAAPAAAADTSMAERVREAPAATAAPAAPPPAARAALGASQLRKQVTAPVIVSPDPNSRWRVVAPGTVERSEDGGRVWIPVRIRAGEDVLAGASPNRLTCWLVGRNGLVLLATDGTNFTRLPFPAAIDLVAVTSPEPRAALVTAADGRTFRSNDAGRTWQLQ